MSIAKNRITMRFFYFLNLRIYRLYRNPQYFYCIKIRTRRFRTAIFCAFCHECALFLRVTIVTLFSRSVKRLFLFLSVLWYTQRRGAVKLLSTALCSVTSYLGRLRRVLCCATFRFSTLRRPRLRTVRLRRIMSILRNYRLLTVITSNRFNGYRF